MTDFTEASDGCTSDISSSSFRSEYNNHDGNNEIRILKSNNDEISILKSGNDEISVKYMLCL